MEYFSKDPSKEYKTVFRIYLPFMYHRLDKWLKEMSANGWHIVHCGFFYFVFEKGNPRPKEYFTYELTQPYNSEGKYSIILRYPLLETQFGVRKKRSKINANPDKAYQILEISTAKVDDYAYEELKSDRNRLYKKKAIVNALYFLLFLVLGVILSVLTVLFAR